MDTQLRNLERRHILENTLESLDAANIYRYRSGLELLPFLDRWQEFFYNQLAHYHDGSWASGAVIRTSTARGVILPKLNKMLTITNFGYEDLPSFRIRINLLPPQDRGFPENYPSNIGMTHNIEIYYAIEESGRIQIEEVISATGSHDTKNCLFYREIRERVFTDAQQLLNDIYQDHSQLIQKYLTIILDCYKQEQISISDYIYAIKTAGGKLRRTPFFDLLISNLGSTLNQQARAYEQTYAFTANNNLPDFFKGFDLRVIPERKEYRLEARAFYDDVPDEDDVEIDAETRGQYGSSNEVYEALTHYLEDQDRNEGLGVKKYGDTWEGALEISDEGGVMDVEIVVSRRLTMAYLLHLLAYSP